MGVAESFAGLEGMTGPEARQLRLDINKRIRDTGKIGASTID